MRSNAGTFEELCSIAEQRGGFCRSGVYVNRQSVFLWQCGCGHQWSAKASSIVSGVWCPKCSIIRKRQISRERNTQRLTIEEIRQTASKRGGECLSKEYVNCGTNLRWRCKEGHEWDANPNSIRRGSWCPFCAGKTRLVSFLDEAREIAASRGGRCLSEKTSDSSKKPKFRWECSEKHQWEADFYSVKRGNWCSQCRGGFGERLVRIAMEQLFQLSFPRARPSWLKGSKGITLELDGYCESLGIGFEHHGQQHFRPISWTGKTSQKEDLKAFAAQKRRDARKLKLCALNGVKVLVFPEIPALLAVEDVKSKIEEELHRLEISLPEGFSERELDFITAYTVPKMREMEAELQQLAAERGGQLVPGSYRGMMEKALWRCAEGHEWEAVCTTVKTSTWCPRCSGRIVTLDDARKLADSRGGACLSIEYVGSLEPMMWSCEDGHQWETNWERTKAGAWCVRCTSNQNKKARLEEMQELAQQRGGECLSTIYVNPQALLLWRCKVGHEWNASAGNVKSAESWCPYCVGKGKVTLEMAQADAAAKGGRCLATEIGGVNTPVRWQCAVGHEWMAAPSKIRAKGKDGTWCPHCSRRAPLSIEHAKKLASGRGGLCLSEVYNGVHQPLDWQCENGHQWAAVLSSIQLGSWCPHCPAGRGRRARMLALDAQNALSNWSLQG